MIAMLIDLGWKSSVICVAALFASQLLRGRAATPFEDGPHAH